MKHKIYKNKGIYTRYTQYNALIILITIQPLHINAIYMIFFSNFQELKGKILDTEVLV